MKAMVCEMCNSNDIQKQDGLYVCQVCGTKYSVEEAKKLMIDGTVNVVGTVSIDNSASYDRIIELARDAYNDKRFDSAYDYYCQAVDIHQDVVENVLRQGLSILAKEAIQSSVPSSCTNRVIRAIDLIKQMSSCEEKSTAIISGVEDLNSACAESKKYLTEEINSLKLQKMKARSAGDILADLGRPAFVVSQNQAEDKKIERHNKAIDEKITAVRNRSLKIDAFEEEYTGKFMDCADVNTQFTYWYKKGTVDKIVALYPTITLSTEEKNKLANEHNYVYWAVKNLKIEFLEVILAMGSNPNDMAKGNIPPVFLIAAFAPNENSRDGYIKAIKLLLKYGVEIDGDFSNDGRTMLNSDTDAEVKNLILSKHPELANKITAAPKKGGCYVATAVYGSYDCPEVWTLRRYRDFELASTWYGRAFVHTYYAVSPTLVKWFGKTEWFKNLWKPTLDRMVEKLNENGVEDTPYDDRTW